MHKSSCCLRNQLSAPPKSAICFSELLRKIDQRFFRVRPPGACCDVIKEGGGQRQQPQKCLLLSGESVIWLYKPPRVFPAFTRVLKEERLTLLFSNDTITLPLSESGAKKFLSLQEKKFFLLACKNRLSVHPVHTCFMNFQERSGWLYKRPFGGNLL